MDWAVPVSATSVPLNHFAAGCHRRQIRKSQKTRHLQEKAYLSSFPKVILTFVNNSDQTATLLLLSIVIPPFIKQRIFALLNNNLFYILCHNSLTSTFYSLICCTTFPIY